MGMAYGDYYGANAVNKSPSPYATMGSSSAGNPAGSYGSSGGASAGAWGTQAPTYAAPVQSFGQQKANEGQQVQGGGYRAPATNYPTYNPQQQQGGYNYPQQQQAPPSFKLPGGGTDQQAMTNWYNSQQSQPQQPQQQAPQSYQNPNTGVYNPQAPKWNPQTQQWEYPQGGYQQQPQAAPQTQPTQPGGVGAPPQGHDTNGYQSPQVVQAPASRYAMPGWDNAKWNDSTNQDPKYVVGRILSNLPGRTDQMGTAVQRIAAAYPGTQQVGNGDISIPGVGVIDILMKAGTGGSGWWWGAGQSGGDGGASSAQQGAPDPYADLIRTLTQQSQMPMQPQQAYDITKDPQYLKLQQQLAAMQTQQNTYLAEQQAGTSSANHPNFAYY